MPEGEKVRGPDEERMRTEKRGEREKDGRRKRGRRGERGGKANHFPSPSFLFLSMRVSAVQNKRRRERAWKLPRQKKTGVHP
jgi:hypothetical protein